MVIPLMSKLLNHMKHTPNSKWFIVVVDNKTLYSSDNYTDVHNLAVKLSMLNDVAIIECFYKQQYKKGVK